MSQLSHPALGVIHPRSWQGCHLINSGQEALFDGLRFVHVVLHVFSHSLQPYTRPEVHGNTAADGKTQSFQHPVRSVRFVFWLCNGFVLQCDFGLI